MNRMGRVEGRGYRGRPKRPRHPEALCTATRRGPLHITAPWPSCLTGCHATPDTLAAGETDVAGERAAGNTPGAGRRCPPANAQGLLPAVQHAKEGTGVSGREEPISRQRSRLPTTPAAPLRSRGTLPGIRLRHGSPVRYQRPSEASRPRRQGNGRRQELGRGRAEVHTSGWGGGWCR
jgi:hypothetical protein